MFLELILTLLVLGLFAWLGLGEQDGAEPADTTATTTEASAEPRTRSQRPKKKKKEKKVKTGCQPENEGYGPYENGESPALPELCSHDDCETCELECDDPASPPRYLKIAWDKQLSGTVKPYRRHLVFCGGERRWPQKLSKDSSSLVTITNSLIKSRYGSEGLTGRVMVTMSDQDSWNREQVLQGISGETIIQGTGSSPVEPTAETDGDKTAEVAGSSEKETLDVIVFPDNIRYFGVQEESLPELIQKQLVEGVPCTTLTHSFLSEDTHSILVCTHRTRDKRCGVVGKMVKEQLEKTLQDAKLGEKVTVHGSTHTGGHKFAGNCLIYPSGDWYGRVTPKDVPVLVQTHFLQQKIYPKLWRGRFNLVKEVQQNLVKDW